MIESPFARHRMSIPDQIAVPIRFHREGKRRQNTGSAEAVGVLDHVGLAEGKDSSIFLRGSALVCSLSIFAHRSSRSKEEVVAEEYTHSVMTIPAFSRQPSAKIGYSHRS